MRKLTHDEHRLVQLIGQAGGSWCPSREETGMPEVWLAVRSLERKKRIWVETSEGALPRYHLTEQGWADAS